MIPLNRTLGPGVVRWMESSLVHGPGDVQGRPYRLDDEQVRHILAAYAIDDNGRRVVRRDVYCRPKGRAKSEFAAALCCAEALGPVRFAGWDARGFPVGRRVTAPFVKCVATEEGQAGNTYGAIEVMLRDGPIADTPGLDVGRTRTFVPGGGEIRAVSAAAASKDGGKETFVNFDETHLYVGELLTSLHGTLRRNLAKRRDAEPWSLETTTMYAPGQMSVAEVAHVYASKIHRGEIRDPGFLFDHRQGCDVHDFEDDALILRSLREAYGEAEAWMDFDRLLAEANEARQDVDHRRRVADFKRYFLNQPTKAEEAVWIPGAVWGGLAGHVDGPSPGVRVGVGVEVDISGTLAAVAVVWEADGRTCVRVESWSVRRGVAAHHVSDGDQVPLGELDAVVVATCSGRPAVVARDERFWDSGDVESSGCDVVGVSAVEQAVAAKRLHQLAHSGGLVHDGDSVTAAQVADTRARETDSGFRVTKAAAGVWPVAVVALIRGLHAYTSERASVYEGRGLLVL